MRICFLADAAHVNTINWVKYFANELKHEVHVITLNNAKDINDVHIHPLNNSTMTSKVKYILHIPKIKKMLKRIKPNVLIGYRLTSYGFLAACTGFRPLILAAQGQNLVYPINSGLRTFFAKYAIKRADLINSWAPHMTKRFLELGANPEKICTMPRGVNTEIFYPRENNDRNIFRIISTRGIDKLYEFELILKAIRVLVSRVNNLECLIAGDGNYKHKLQQLSKSLKLERYVKFIGNIEYSKLPGYLRDSDIYVSSVRTDGVSMSLLEAMSCGVFPIVVDNVANRLWIKNGENGYLYPPGDYELLSEKIYQAMRDDGIRNHAATENYQLVKERACWQNNMKKMDNAYQNLINS